MHFVFVFLKASPHGRQELNKLVIKQNVTSFYECFDFSSACMFSMCVPMYIYRRQYIYSI